jgi:hypothetical protein
MTRPRGQTTADSKQKPPENTPRLSLKPKAPTTPGSRGESHPPAPTDPDVNLSIHPALVLLVTKRSGTRSSGRTVQGTRW